MRRPEPSASLTPIGVLLALLAITGACRAGDGDRCACAEDCRRGFACVAEGRVLEAGECTPIAGDNVSPGVCLDADEAVDEDGIGGPPEVFMDLGSKRDFDPGPDPGGSGSSSSSGETGATGSTGTGSTTGTSSGGTTSTGGNGGSSSSGGSSGTTTGAT